MQKSLLCNFIFSALRLQHISICYG